MLFPIVLYSETEQMSSEAAPQTDEACGGRGLVFVGAAPSPRPGVFQRRRWKTLHRAGAVLLKRSHFSEFDSILQIAVTQGTLAPLV